MPDTMPQNGLIKMNQADMASVSSVLRQTDVTVRTAHPGTDSKWEFKSINRI